MDNTDDVLAAFEQVARKSWEASLADGVLHTGDVTRVIVYGTPEELEALAQRLKQGEEPDPTIGEYIVCFFLLMLETLAQLRRERVV